MPSPTPHRTDAPSPPQTSFRGFGENSTVDRLTVATYWAAIWPARVRYVRNGSNPVLCGRRAKGEVAP
jgi:hypothetical protein